MAPHQAAGTYEYQHGQCRVQYGESSGHQPSPKEGFTKLGTRKAGGDELQVQLQCFAPPELADKCCTARLQDVLQGAFEDEEELEEEGQAPIPELLGPIRSELRRV